MECFLYSVELEFWDHLQVKAVTGDRQEPLVVRPGASSSFLLLVVRMLLVAMPETLVASLLLVVGPGAPTVVASCC